MKIYQYKQPKSPPMNPALRTPAVNVILYNPNKSRTPH